MPGGGFDEGFSDGFDIGFDAALIAELSGLFGGFMPALRQNFSLTRRDDAQISILVTNGDGTALGATSDNDMAARWTFGRKEFGLILGEKTRDNGLDIGADDDGNILVVVNLASEDTDNLLGDYHHELELTLEGVVGTVTKGRFAVRPDMQEAASEA